MEEKKSYKSVSERAKGILDDGRMFLNKRPTFSDVLANTEKKKKKGTKKVCVCGGWGGGGGGSGTYEELVQAPQHAKTEETVSHRQNNNVKEVGTPPVRSNLCTSLIAVSTAARAEQSHKDSVRKATVEEQLSSKTINPTAMRAQLRLPALDLSWALNALFIDNSTTRQSILL